MPFEDPDCSLCPPEIRICREGLDPRRSPAWCPTRTSPNALAQGRHGYDDPFLGQAHGESTRVEAEGYGAWTRVEEICAFAKRMKFEKLGVAFCIGCIDLASVFCRILKSHGFQVASVACKTGSVPKEEAGLRDKEKVRPGEFEAICNPIAQAEVLNQAGTDFNVVIGLCVGHDSLFYRHSRALVTTLVAKDRALGHNPAAALFLADGYLRRVWGPEKTTPA